MYKQLRRSIKRFTPPVLVYGLGRLRARVNWTLWVRRVRRTFEVASTELTWLGWNELERLQAQYPAPPDYGYHPDTLERRGVKRANQILSLPRLDGQTVNSLLELGCWDGMVSWALRQRGKTTAAVDFRDIGFDERARQAGVVLLQMDASHLGFADESFDMVFSYDSMEHFAQPDRVMAEAIRVVKPGGYIYLDFGPLYDSHQGLHAYNSITVPYCQFLFRPEMMQEFCRLHGLGQINFEHVNGWSLEAYRRLWKQCGDRLKLLNYHETRSLGGLDLIINYPACFRSKTSSFDSLTIGYIKALFQKIR